MSNGILVVDDNPNIRHLLRAYVESNGFSVCGEAENGAEAIERAKELQPALILLDVTMPVMTGTEAAPILKQTIPDVKIIYSLVKNLGFMLVFNTETQPCMPPSKTLLQKFINVLCCHLRVSNLKIRFPLRHDHGMDIQLRRYAWFRLRGQMGARRIVASNEVLFSNASMSRRDGRRSMDGRGICWQAIEPTL